MDQVAKDKLVYALLDQRTAKGEYKYGDYVFEHEPFYVGKGDKTRPHQHARLALKFPERKSFKNNKIRSIFEDTGEKPIINIVATGLSDAQAKMVEKSMIDTIGNFLGIIKGPLTNVALDPDIIPPPPSGDRHYSKDPCRAKEAHRKKVERLGYNYLTHTKDGVSYSSIKVKNGTSHMFGETNPNKIAIANGAIKKICPWLDGQATLRSKLAWFLKDEIENLAKLHPELGYRSFAKVVNASLNILDTYGFEIDENMPFKVAHYRKWTEHKLKLWQEWKSTYKPQKIT